MQQGQILTHTDGHTRKILGICGEVYFLSGIDDYDDDYPAMMTENQIKDAGYIIPKEQWKPEEDEYYYGLTMGFIVRRMQNNTSFDKEIIESGNCFKTEAEAQIAADKIKDLLKGL